MQLADLIRVARGDEPADLVLRNAQLVNVFSGQVEPADVAIGGGVTVDSLQGGGSEMVVKVLDLSALGHEFDRLFLVGGGSALQGLLKLLKRGDNQQDTVRPEYT